MPVVRTLMSILFLKRGPQDLPYSQTLLQLLVLLYVVSGIFALQSTLGMETAAANMILDVLIILLYTRIVLTALNRRPRFTQTACAMIGIGIVFHVIALPVLMQQGVGDAEQVISGTISLIMLLLLSWNLLVFAYIYQHALGVGITNAILLSFALFFISIAMSRFLVGS